jgi:hypothetical protein
MAQQSRLGFVLTASMLMFLTAPAWTATAPVIEGAFANKVTNQLTIIGSDFEPAGTAPTVTFAGEALAVVSSSNTKVVATLPAGLPAGSYRLSLTNSSSQVATITATLAAVPVVGPGQTYAGWVNVTTALPGVETSLAYSLTLEALTHKPQGGDFTIVPANCTITAVYAALVQWIPDLPAIPSISVSLQQNSQSTDFPVCQVSSPTPTACPLPELPSSPVSVSAGDTLNYAITIPAGAVEQASVLNMTLQCQ